MVQVKVPMKRFRHYVRQGWHIVEVSRTNLYNVQGDGEWGNQAHFNMLYKWCHNTFEPKQWTASLHGPSGTDKPEIKRFAFKEERDAVFFKLKWIT